MRKILIIANYKGPVGGISGQVEELCRHLNEEKEYEADIFSTKGSVFKRVGLFFCLLIQARKYDVLHVHGCSEWGFLPIVYGICAGKFRHKRIVVTYHGGGADGFFERHATVVKRWLSSADKVIVLNGFMKQVFDKYSIPCEIIPNCITLSTAKKHSPYQWNAPRFISVRHLRELYNIPCILKAYAEIKKQIPDCSLTILGDGPLRGKFEEWVRANAVQSVSFVGQISNAAMADYLANSDVMLSAPHIDNMPVSVMEAMNAGVLVISSRVGGVPYMIEDERNGLLFEDDDLEGLKNKMLNAIHYPEKMACLVNQAKQDVKQYTWAELRKQSLSLYEHSF